MIPAGMGLIFALFLAAILIATAGFIYLVFYICVVVVRNLNSEREWWPATATFLAAMIIICIRGVLVSFPIESTQFPCFAIGMIGFGTAIIQSIRWIASHIPKARAKPAENFPRLQFWLQDLILLVMFVGIALLIAPAYVSSYIPGLGEHPDEAGNMVLFWPTTILGADSENNQRPWIPYVLALNGATMLATLDLARRTSILQRPIARAAYFACMQLMAIFFGCAPIYGWAIWRFVDWRIRRAQPNNEAVVGIDPLNLIP